MGESSNPPLSCPTERAFPAVRASKQLSGLLVVTAGELVGRALPFPAPGHAAVLGRSPESVVPFRALSLSREHARLLRQGDEYVILDSGSTNGTFVNGNRIEHSVALKHGDQVRLGSEITLRFSLVDPEEAAGLAIAGEANDRDLLTGAWTRTHLELSLDQELQRAQASGEPLSVLMADLDRFKQVNDKYGHLAGDEALAAIGRTLRECIRGTDVLARYGGEEFVIVAPGTPLEKARLVAERIRRAVAAAHLSWNGKPIRMTISIGVASLACCGSEPDRLTLLWLADQRVYLAKQTRDAVVSTGGSAARFIFPHAPDATHPGAGRR